MKSSFAFLFGLCLLILSASDATAQNEYHDQILAELETVAAKFIDAGDEVILWEADALDIEIDPARMYTVSLTAGKSYALVGVCDSDCSNLDLSIYDGHGKTVLEDVEADITREMMFTVTESGEFTLDVVMQCSNLCYYGVGLFEW